MRWHWFAPALAALGLAGSPAAPAASATPTLSLIGDYATGLGELSAETVAHHQGRLYVTNSADNSLDIVDISAPGAPQRIRRIPLAAYGAGPNSVDVYNGTVVVAVEANPKTAPGKVVFFDRDGRGLGAVNVGALPDMLTFTPDGRKVIVANEGEPNSYGQADSVDPLGSVSIVTLRFLAGTRPGSWIPGTVKTVDFTPFNAGGPRHAELSPAIRIYGPGASVAQDLEPEYVAVSPDSRTAYVTLQENNAIAEIDIARGQVVALRPLGLKDHAAAGAGLDASDRDDAINVVNWPVKGMYEPDAVAYVQIGGGAYLVTANEGDARDYTGFAEEVRVGSGSYVLDPTVFPNAAALKANANLGRLTVSRATGDTDGDSDVDEIHVLGGRSFSIWNAATGALVADSGDVIESRVAATFPANFNSNNDENTFDDRSDNKGPEPEAVAVGVVDGRTYAFVGLERQGGVMTFDITVPAAPAFVEYVNNRDFADDPPGPDSGPEILRFVPAADSPTGGPLLLVANEISGTVALFAVQTGP